MDKTEDKPFELTAQIIEIHSGIEVISPSITRYAVGPKFSKIVFDPFTGCWKVFGKSGRIALIGPSNVKGVILSGVPSDVAAKAPRGKSKAA